MVRGTYLVLAKRLLDLLEVGQQADVAAHLVRRLRHARQDPAPTYTHLYYIFIYTYPHSSGT
jgi:hypothetical protein